MPGQVSLLSARVSEFLKVVEKERLEAIFRPLFPIPAPLLIGRQVSRVLLWIVPESDRHAILDRPTLQAAFRRKALIPPALVQQLTIHESRTGMDAELLAICFAACAFPERAFQMDQAVELPGRIAAFLDALAFLRGFGDDSPPPLEVAHRLLASAGALADGVGAGSLTQLLADLSAAEAVADGWPGELTTTERLTGAALFLVTSPVDRLRDIMRNWRQERDFLCSLRQQICTTPLAWLRDVPAASRRPEWPDVKLKAAQALEDVPEQHLDSAIVLTQMAWNKVADLRLAMPFDSVRDFWDNQMEKLSSGFPYFAFLSRFTYWWKQCLLTHTFYRPGEELPDDDHLRVDATSEETPGETISPALLRSLREGYRLVRTTFFRRADSISSVTELESDTVRHNEVVRRALDAIWYERLSRLDEEDASVEMVKHIAERFPDLGLDTITNLTHRLPIRMQAYALARCRRLSNSEIEAFKRVTSTVAGQLKEEYPFKGETGFLPVTSLVRGLPLERSLLWALAAFVFLFPKVVPQRPDPWTLDRFLRELWFWLSDDPSPESTESLPWCELGHPALASVNTLRHDPVLDELLRDLMTCSTPDDLAQWKPKSGAAQVEALANRIRTLFPVRTVARLFSRQGIAQLRRVCDHLNHWIVPVWYYAVVEDEAAATLPFRLVVEAAAVPRVEALHQSILALAALAPDSLES